MKISDLARRSGLTTHTIRYYEKIGLLPPAARGSSTHREYDDAILPWVEFIGRLKTTGMPLREMVRYAELRSRGSESEPQRRELLVAHRDRVSRHMAAHEAARAALDAKIEGYQQTRQRTA